MVIGSNKQDLVGESMIVLQITSSLTGSKAFKAEGSRVGAYVTQPEVGNVSQILLILSQKNSKLVCEAFI